MIVIDYVTLVKLLLLISLPVTLRYNNVHAGSHFVKGHGEFGVVSDEVFVNGDGGFSDGDA